jgi:hypothetical protein
MTYEVISERWQKSEHDHTNHSFTDQPVKAEEKILPLHLSICLVYGTVRYYVKASSTREVYPRRISDSAARQLQLVRDG